MFACKTSKRTTQGPTIITNTKTDKNERDRTLDQEMDTIYWTEIDRINDYNRRIEDIDLEKKDRYNVSLLIPFDIERNKASDVDQEETKLGRMMQYYAGVKLALAQLEQEGISLDVDVYDAESGNFDRKLRASRDADLIIGPRQRDQLEIVANFGKANAIPIVSPWLSSRSIAEENPLYIQLIPSVRDHYGKIVDHVKSRYDNDQVFLIGRNNSRDKAVINYIQTVAEHTGSSNQGKFQEFYVNIDSLREGEEAFDKIFFEDKSTVFIIPHYSFSEDENFVYNCVRKLSGEKGLMDVVVYGMPLMMESDKIKFELYNNLNMRICRSNYVDREDPAVKAFRQLYFEAYNDFPSEEAFKGFDMMLFFGRNMYDYGKKFHFFLDRYEAEMLQTRFDIQRVMTDDDTDNFEKINYLQNKHLYILAFDNYRFNKQ